MSAERSEQGFFFLFRNDRGQIDRATWWRGTVPLAIVGLLATAGWLGVRPFTREAITQPPALAILGYLYLVAFSFVVILLFICEYNLSAKRFQARGKPAAMAAILPGIALIAAACVWYVPRSQGAVPGWSIWIVLAAAGLVILWNVVELGVRRTER